MIKGDYCKENNINLLRIKYNDTPASLNQRQSLLKSSGDTGAYYRKYNKLNLKISIKDFRTKK